MMWWLVKECFSAMIRPLRLTAPSGECVAVKNLHHSELFVNIH